MSFLYWGWSASPKQVVKLYSWSYWRSSLVWFYCSFMYCFMFCIAVSPRGLQAVTIAIRRYYGRRKLTSFIARKWICFGTPCRLPTPEYITELGTKSVSRFKFTTAIFFLPFVEKWRQHPPPHSTHTADFNIHFCVIICLVHILACLAKFSFKQALCNC